ncbi:MAG: response regulator [Deltaproteobacteria bacterium]|nr:response regulator [Deltaproteobacteria bacterium]
MVKKPFVVLLAEDDEHDIVATNRAWQKHNIANQLYIVNDGEECLDFLRRRGKYSEPGAAPRPGILLLDIKMPRMDGLTVLKHIREDEELQHLPVIILTTSKAEEDRLKGYNLGVNAYIVKPVGFENFSEAVRTINLFWQLVELPRGEHEPHEDIATPSHPAG